MEMLKNIIIIMRYITGINTSNPDLEANKNSLLIFLIKLFTINLEINYFIFFISNCLRYNSCIYNVPSVYT